jgi:hypothetical protein
LNHFATGKTNKTNISPFNPSIHPNASLLERT